MKIPKGSYDNDALAPAWLEVVDAQQQPLKPLIRCKCGKVAGIGLHHVHADGHVTASFYHPVEGWESEKDGGCGFHEMLELDGYTGPEFLPVPR